MTTMLERAADEVEAMFSFPMIARPAALRIARAVLMAVREPDDVAVVAGICERHQTNVPEAWSKATANIYKSMIDSILNEPAS